MDTCVECSAERDNDRDRRIWDDGAEHGYREGRRDAEVR